MQTASDANGIARVSRERVLPRERVFYLSMSISFLVAILIGFAQTFYLRPFFPDVKAPNEPLIYVHGAIFSTWFVLIVVQAWLISTRRVALHRTLGKIGAAVAVLMVVMGTTAAFIGANRPGGYFGLPRPLVILGLELYYMPMFAALAGAGIAFRRSPQIHKRLLLLATISIMPVALARFPVIYTWSKGVQFYLADLWIIPMLLWDYSSRGRIHAVTLLGGCSLVLWQRFTLYTIAGPVWLSIAAWATDLVR